MQRRPTVARDAAAKRRGMPRTLTRASQRIATNRKRSRSAREEAVDYLTRMVREEPISYDNAGHRRDPAHLCTFRYVARVGNDPHSGRKGVRRMRRRRLIVLVVLGALLAAPVPAQAEVLLDGTNVVATATSVVDDPMGTATSPVNDEVGTVMTNIGNAVGTVTSTVSGTAGSIVGGANTASQTPQGTASPTVGSSSGGSGGTSPSNGRNSAGSHGNRKAPGRSYRTRFDRLPRRAEILIERIELGRNMRANLGRLEALLRRFPALRAELARALTVPSSPVCERAALRARSGARCAGSFVFSERWHLP